MFNSEHGGLVGGLRSIAECDELIRQHAAGTLKLSPGMGADETLEARLQVCIPPSIKLCYDPHEAQQAVREPNHHLL